VVKKLLHNFLSVKDWLFLETLYRRCGKVVSYEDIKRAEWPERYIIHNNFSIVVFEEVNMMSYRLRKKIGKYQKNNKKLEGIGVYWICSRAFA